MSEGSQGLQVVSEEKCPMKEEVRSLIYWRNPIRSAIVLTALLVVEFSFLCLSAISLLAYTGFLLLLVVNGLRLYYQHISKTENKILKEFLDREITIPEDRVADVSRRLTDMLNRQLVLTRDIFLLKNLSASIKFGIILYVMTYVGARFNFLTLCIIATITAFVIPKFYESYQSEIDRGLEVVRKKTNKIIAQIGEKMDKLPVIGSKKPKTN